MASVKRLSCLIIVLCLCMRQAIAADLPPENFASWLHDLEAEAIASGISSKTAQAALENALLDERVIAYDHKQPEQTITFNDYVRGIVTSQRVAEGRKQLETNAAILHQIADKYGVPPQIIVALWGMESSFGKHSGYYNVVDSLMTLAFEGRRADFFRTELFSALRILDQEHIPATALRGSWAGAMGQCQFMPSTYLKYAVDYDGNGVRNIWNSQPDIFASIANYVAAEGWHDDQNWGQEVDVSTPIAAEQIGFDNPHSLAEWSNMGIVAKDGTNLENQVIQAYLIQPGGVDGRSFLVYDNYRALMRWNRSTYFATAVGLLADRIK